MQAGRQVARCDRKSGHVRTRLGQSGPQRGQTCPKNSESPLSRWEAYSVSLPGRNSSYHTKEYPYHTREYPYHVRYPVVCSGFLSGGAAFVLQLGEPADPYRRPHDQTSTGNTCGTTTPSCNFGTSPDSAGGTAEGTAEGAMGRPVRLLRLHHRLRGPVTIGQIAIQHIFGVALQRVGGDGQATGQQLQTSLGW